MDPMKLKLLEHALRLGISITPTNEVATATSVQEAPISNTPPAPPTQSVVETTVVPAQAEVKVPPAPVLAAGIEVVEPPLMRPDWEKELDDMLAQHGGRMEIKLQSGATLRVVPDPKKATDALEISHKTFKRLSRAAAILNGRVVDAMTKEQSDARTQAMLDKGEGCWITPHIFIEVDKQQAIPGGRGASDFGVIAAPKLPPGPPPIVANLWLVLSAASIVEQVPMRISSGKVIGTLIKTQNGALYGRQVRDGEHRLNIQAGWAMSGGYAIEREIYDKYLTDPTTVIKMTREDRVFLTTSNWIQRYGGLIRHWGTEKIVMPITSGYWLVVDKNGEIIQ